MADYWYRLSLRIVPRLFVLLVRLWFATCRVRVVGSEHRDRALEHGPVVAAFWHYSFVYLFYHLRRYPAAVMVSASRDGEYIAEAARLMGHTPLRGSSNRQGVSALRAMLKAIRGGRNCGIVADGSQGPARRAQAGCLLVSSRSGRPVLPVCWAASRYLAFKSWDRTVIPLPFSTVVLRYGEPLVVPGELDSAQLEQCRLLLEQQLNELYTWVWEQVRPQPHDQEQGVP
ncbi:lysophospholipid acyltransferase family protein [Desulfogranum mediterraneum]|uniref:lysophospholipid acyltransferase family protein n=1 Tax=Desulfogranum mediterraneum TaxID=160661 RepID=UPI0003FD5B58|nr:lysophospholipid acyltransferase family protein [Desulfogranum mediterraneum]